MSRKTALNVSIQFKLGERSQESLILVKVIITKIEVMGISANKKADLSSRSSLFCRPFRKCSRIKINVKILVLKI